MNTPDFNTVSARPFARSWVSTTTPDPMRLRLLGSHAICILCVLVSCGLAPGITECADEAEDICGGRSSAEPTVQRFVIRSSSTPAESREAIALAAARRARTDGEPLVLGGMNDRIERKLQFAFPSALERVCEVAACANLFSELGADGLETLGVTVYVPATSGQDLQLCEDADAIAFTGIGRSKTRLCAEFGRQPRQAVAMILIHEALHHAGMSERPHDPDALTSGQINSLVRTNCNL